MWNWHLTISFRSKARAASSPPGLLLTRGASPPPRLMSAWMRALLLCTFSMSRHEPPLEFRMPLRPLGSGGRPSTEAWTLPTRLSAAVHRLPFIATQGTADSAPKCAFSLSELISSLSCSGLVHRHANLLLTVKKTVSDSLFFVWERSALNSVFMSGFLALFCFLSFVYGDFTQTAPAPPGKERATPRHGLRVWQEKDCKCFDWFNSTTAVLRVDKTQRHTLTDQLWLMNVPLLSTQGIQLY